MDPESEPVHVDVPSDQDLRVGMLRTMEAMFLHAQAGERLLLSIQAQVAGMMSVAGVVDENEARAETDRDVAGRKEIITFLYEKSHQYVTVVIAGAFAAYFATLVVKIIRLVPNCPRPQTTDIGWIADRRLLRNVTVNSLHSTCSERFWSV